MLILPVKRPLPFLLGALTLLVGCRAAVAQTYNVTDCEKAFAAANLAAISSAFNLCTPPPSPPSNAMQSMGALSGHAAAPAATDFAEVQRNLYLAHEVVARDTVKLTLANARENKKNKKDLDWVKLSGFVIGGIGGGLGGGLRLVNNPSVSHAGTVVGMGAGILGAAINFGDYIATAPNKTQLLEISSRMKTAGGKPAPTLHKRQQRVDIETMAQELSDLSDRLEAAQKLLDEKRKEILESPQP
jgi:hypothetical protein